MLVSLVSLKIKCGVVCFIHNVIIIFSIFTKMEIKEEKTQISTVTDHCHLKNKHFDLLKTINEVDFSNWFSFGLFLLYVSERWCAIKPTVEFAEANPKAFKTLTMEALTVPYINY